MACIEYIYSVSALIGNGNCNAKCDFCAATDLRPDAITSLHNDRLFETAIKLSARHGGWSLSLTGAGEPTVDPESITHALEIYNKAANQGAYFPNVNLFTNGIMFGKKPFCKEYLPRWRELGLTNIAVSIHELTSEGQAKVYGLSHYPELEEIANNVREHGVGARGTLLLRKGGIENAEKYEEAIHTLIPQGYENITSWPVGNPNGTRNEFTPTRKDLLGIRWWIMNNAKKCMGHVWGGGVYDYGGTILRYTDYVTKHNKRKNFVRQLVVFQDETVAYSWIREGALCMK